MTAIAADLERSPVLPIAVGESRSTRAVSWLGALALLPMIGAHVLGAAVVDPVLDPISWYAFVPGGGELILAGGVTLAVLGLLLTARMYRTGLATGPVPGCAMIVFAAAMVLVGAFPTDPPGTAVTLSATVHRISAAAAFCVLPIVGLGLQRSIARPRSRHPEALRSAARALGVVVALFLVVHLSLVIFADSGIAAFGLIERAGFVIMIGYLYLLAATIDREAPREEADAAGGVVADAVIVPDVVIVPGASEAGYGPRPLTSPEPAEVPGPPAVLSGSRSADPVV